MDRVQIIIDTVAKMNQLCVAELMSDSRARRIARPRMVAMYLARDITKRSMQDLGKRFNKHHTSVLHAEVEIPKLASSDDAFANRLEAIRRACEAAFEIPDARCCQACGQPLPERSVVAFPTGDRPEPARIGGPRATSSGRAASL